MAAKRTKDTPVTEAAHPMIELAQPEKPAPRARKAKAKAKAKVAVKAKSARRERPAPRPGSVSPERDPVTPQFIGDDGASGGDRDEAALAREVAERLRALLVELGLEKVLGGLSPRDIAQQLGTYLHQLVPAARKQLLDMLRATLASDYLKPDTWKGLLYLVQSSIESNREGRKRRERGDYETDDFGFDEEFFHGVRPVTSFLYERWWRVDATGVANVPAEGRALMVANHSGVLPFDGAMITEAIWHHHPTPRYARWLFLKWFNSLPFVSILLQRSGCAMACHENGQRLLERDHLVGVFPEGLKGVGKLFRDRYRLARFGRGGFIRMAMRTRAPIIPVSVVGAEEIYPVLTHLDWIAKPLGLPMAPLTPTFPLLGVLGLIPLPSKWSIHFGEPIRFNETAPDRADDFLVVSLLSERVRDTIQRQINDQLRLRKGVFWG